MIEEKKGKKKRLTVQNLQHGLDLGLHLLGRGHTGRVDVVETGSDTRVVSLVLEGLDQLHVGLGGLDGDDVSVQSLDRPEDVVEVGVAEVGVDLCGQERLSSQQMVVKSSNTAGPHLSLGLGNGGREPEGVDSPVPVDEEPKRISNQ